MGTYLEVIGQAAVFFVFVAFVFTLPYMVYNYHKYGSVIGLRILIVYSFILYMLCVYFLVILPLPSREAVAAMTSPRTQLVPFHFVRDIAKDIGGAFNPLDPASYRALLGSKALMQVLFNIFMTLPFGVYLRYYFGMNLKKTALASFLLSLFFELTQLSGLYFIYPRSYRLFDVDDLMANTLGGVLGYLAVGPFLRVLPTRDEIDAVSFRRGREVSLARRLVALFFDVLGCGVFSGLLGAACALLGVRLPAAAGVLGYFILLPLVWRGQTLGGRITRTRIVSAGGGPARFYQYPLRYGSIAVVFWLVPYALGAARGLWSLSPLADMVLVGLMVGGYGFYLLFAAIMVALHKPLFYEKISRTRIASSIPDQG